MQKQYKIMQAVLLFGVTAVLIFWPFQNNNAHALGLTTPFGGRVLSIIPCTCQYTAWMLPRVVVVGPPRSGAFLETIFTRLYKYFNVSPGNWVLGIAANYDVACMQTAGTGCAPSGFYPFMLKIGTSATSGY